MIAGVLGKTPNGEITEEQMLLKLFVFLPVTVGSPGICRASEHTRQLTQTYRRLQVCA